MHTNAAMASSTAMSVSDVCKKRLIASNVPSAIITMGHIGRMTNIEKIIFADNYPQLTNRTQYTQDLVVRNRLVK